MKRTVSETRRVVEEHDETRVFMRSGSSLMSSADGQRQFAGQCAKVDDPGDKGCDENQDGSDKIPGRFGSQFDAIVAPQGNIGEVAPWTLGEVFSLALEHLKAVAGHLKQRKDAKIAAHERTLLVAGGNVELSESALSFEDRVEDLLAVKASLDADAVALDVECGSLNESLMAENAELDRLQVTINVKSDFVELLEDCLKQRKTLSKKTKQASEAQLAEANVQPDAVMTERKAQKDVLLDEVHRLSSDRGVISVELTIPPRQLGTAVRETGIISRQLSERKNI